jgi:hypothetical protein
MQKENGQFVPSAFTNRSFFGNRTRKTKTGVYFKDQAGLFMFHKFLV